MFIGWSSSSRETLVLPSAVGLTQDLLRSGYINPGKATDPVETGFRCLLTDALSGRFHHDSFTLKQHGGLSGPDASMRIK